MIHFLPPRLPRLLLLSFLIIAISLAVTGHPVRAAEDLLDLEAQAAALVEAESSQILYCKECEQPLPPASITKNMSLLLVFEAIEEGKTGWEETVIVSQKAWETGGSRMFLEIGQEVSVRDLVKGIAIISANDACVAIAEHLYGSEAAFVRRMNERAGELGLDNTNFQNSSGLPHPDHYMSATDIARLSRHIVQHYPEALDFFSQQEFTFNGIKQYNRNPLLGRYPGADGLKTGHTQEAGYCLAATAVQDDMRLIAVVLNSPDETARQQDIETLLNYGFRHYELVTLHRADESVASVSIARGTSPEIPVVSEKNIRAVVPAGREDELEEVVVLDGQVTAPVEQGEPVGKLIVKLDGKEIAETTLLAGETVKRANFLVLIFREAASSIAGFGQQISSYLRGLLDSLLNRL